MKKPIGPLLLLFLVMLIASSFYYSEGSMHKREGVRIVPTQDEEGGGRKGGKDSRFVLALKELKEKVDGWLKSLNERIEREDVTRFEVRFLEILRSILEWVKEKIDYQIKSWEEGDPKNHERGGAFRKTYQIVSPSSAKG